VCGILGATTDGPADAWERRVTDALDAVDHRGPDARAVRALSGGAVTCILGHTRLRIIDLSPKADQPMPNEDGTVWVTYNGELYNHRELRRELEHSGHSFRSTSDTEVLVHLYEREDGDVPAMLRRLRGMFAFALFDTARGRLVLARDRLGIKPMYHAEVPGGVAFASGPRTGRRRDRCARRRGPRHLPGLGTDAR
jgi:asparagine synthase (glutamine-hydrolysing)